VSDGHLAVIAHRHSGLLAKDIAPPRARRHWAQDGAVFPLGQIAGGLRGAAQLTMDLLGISMGQELLQEGIGLAQAGDGFCGKERRQPALKVVVTALDFAFGLGRGGITQRHPIEMQAGAQPGESIGSVGEEQGMVGLRRAPGAGRECERLAPGNPSEPGAFRSDRAARRR